jgi:glycosyltransferase involved in cell wall biosynthesis
MPKVSVIIPNYNHYDFLIQRIESVLNQTFQDFELLLLDDASTDQSHRILKQYRKHIKVSHIVINSENSGSVFKQWIKGVELATGDYIWIAESDDFAGKNFLEETVASLKTNDKLGLVFTDTTKVDENGNVLGLVSKSKKMLVSADNSNIVITKSNFVNFLLTHLTIVNASSVLFRRSALLSVDFNALKGFKNTGDVFTYVGVVLNYDLMFLSKPLNYMRFHSSNTTAKNKKNGQVFKDKILLLDYYLDDFSRIDVKRNDVVDCLNGFLLLSIDYGHLALLKKLLKKMYERHFLERKKYYSIKKVIFFYQYFMFSGRPQFLREWLKTILKKSL